MNQQSFYQRYRIWAEKNFSGEGYRAKYFLISLASGIIAVVLLRLLPIASSVKFWTYLIPVLGLIAAVDAWGAARHRGNPKEGWIRAIAIMIIIAAVTIFIAWSQAKLGRE